MCHSACRSVWERVSSQNKEAAPTEGKERVSEPTVTLLDPEAGNSPGVRFSPIMHNHPIQSISSNALDPEDGRERAVFAAWEPDQRVDRSVPRESGIGRTEIIEIQTLGSNSNRSRTIHQESGIHRPASKPSKLPTPPIAGSGRSTPIQGSGRVTPPIDLLAPRNPTSLYRPNFQSRK